MWSAYDDRDELQSLTAADREALEELARGYVTVRITDASPERFRPLLSRGLAFRSHCRVSITTKGEEVLERVS